MASSQEPLSRKPVAPLLLSLRGGAKAPLGRRIYTELRDAVLSGRLASGARLPSTRAMAAELGVSRNTVLNAYEQLLAEGYFEGQVGAGTFVAHTVNIGRSPAAPPPREGRLTSQRGAILAANPVIPRRRHDAPRPFRPNPPDSHFFPRTIWARLLARRWRGPLRELLCSGEPNGYRPLREAIAEHVRAARAVRCHADQIVIVAGSQQGLDLAARLLLDPGDAVWMEDPGYLGARAVLLGAGARLVPVPLDAEGLDVNAAAAAAPAARMAYVTPSWQFPMGVPMSVARRLALIDWAARAGAWILEDDYDSEFHYTGRPIPAMQGLDYAGRVLYLGSFSKVLFPSLRLGYLILPPDLVDPFAAARATTDRHSPSVEQAVLADFLGEGHFVRHIRRMRTLYAERQAVLVDAAARHLAGRLDVRPASAGMHLMGWLPDGVSDAETAKRAIALGVEAPPLSAYCLRPSARSGLLLGYAAFSPRQIREGVRRLADAF